VHCAQAIPFPLGIGSGYRLCSDSLKQTTSELWCLPGGKREDYQNCSVLYRVLKLCTVISTLRWAVLTVLWIGFCHNGPISLCIDLFVFISVYFSYCITVSTVGWTWWDWSLIHRTYLHSVFWHCWLGHLTCKNVSPICVWWSLNLTQPTLPYPEIFLNFCLQKAWFWCDFTVQISSWCWGISLCTARWHWKRVGELAAGVPASIIDRQRTKGHKIRMSWTEYQGQHWLSFSYNWAVC